MKHLILFLLLGLMPVLVLADDDHERARQLKDLGQILPLQQILKAAQAEHPGRVLEVELEDEDGRYVYEIELLDERGEVWELYFDATDGKLIKSERED